VSNGKQPGTLWKALKLIGIALAVFGVVLVAGLILIVVGMIMNPF